MDRESKRAVRVIGQKYGVDILEALSSPKSIEDIVDGTDVPIASCYRTIHLLEGVGLVRVKEVRTRNVSRPTKIYERVRDSFTIRPNKDGKYVLDTSFDGGPVD